MPKLDDFADLCDPQEMGRERNELAEYMNLEVSKDTDGQTLFSFGWIISRSCQSCSQWLAKCYVCQHLQLPVRECSVLLVVFWRSAEQPCHQQL